MMRHTNQVILLGQVEEEPEVRYYDHEHLRAVIRLRTDIVLPREDGQGQERTQWHSLVLRDGLARKAETHVHAGAIIEVEGVLLYRREVDRLGVSQLITEVLCHRLDLLQIQQEAPAKSSLSQMPAVDDELPWEVFSPTETEDPMA